MSAFKRGVNRRKPKWNNDWCERCQSYGNVHDPEKHGIRMSKKEENA